MDVVGAYLAADLEEEVYVTQPEGYEDPQNKQGVWRLHKALYGLKQSARAWYGRLRKHLLSLGFTTNPVDPCLFQREREGKLMLVLVHVDDLGAGGRLPTPIRHIQERHGEGVQHEGARGDQILSGYPFHTPSRTAKWYTSTRPGTSSNYSNSFTCRMPKQS